MSDPRLIADKYISRGGGEPEPSRDRFVSDVCDVARFLLWHDDNHMMGGVKARDAYAAFCRLVNLEPHVIRKVIRD